MISILLAETTVTQPTFSVIWAGVASVVSVLAGAVAVLFKSNEKKAATQVEALTGDKAALLASNLTMSKELKEKGEQVHELALKAVEVITESRLSIGMLPAKLEEKTGQLELLIVAEHEKTRGVVSNE